MQVGTENLRLQMQTETELFKLHMKDALDEPWDQKPIRFQDAIGRRYPVPLEICGNFEVAPCPDFCPGTLIGVLT